MSLLKQGFATLLRSNLRDVRHCFFSPTLIMRNNNSSSTAAPPSSTTTSSIDDESQVHTPEQLQASANLNAHLKQQARAASTENYDSLLRGRPIAEIIGDVPEAFMYFEERPVHLSKRKSRELNPPVVPEQRNNWTLETFLKRIGRGCENHIAKIASWEKLFSSRGADLKKLGIATKERRWILRWTEHFRQGIDPVFITKAQSKARKNNPGMEKRRRQKYAGWARYMFPEYEGVEELLAERKQRRQSGADLVAAPQPMSGPASSKESPKKAQSKKQQ